MELCSEKNRYSLQVNRYENDSIHYEIIDIRYGLRNNRYVFNDNRYFFQLVEKDMHLLSKRCIFRMVEKYMPPSFRHATISELWKTDMLTSFHNTIFSTDRKMTC